MPKIGQQTTLPGMVIDAIEDLLDVYRLSLVASNRSAKTITWYLEILRRFFAFLDAEKLARPLCEIGTKEVKAYILHRQTTAKWANNPKIKKGKGKLSPFSVQGDVRAIKAFWSWLLDEGYVDENSIAKLPLPKVPKHIVKTLTLEQIKQLLNAVDRHKPVGARDYCMVLLLIDTGLRISELIGIKMTDVDLMHGVVKVVGKGQKERVIPFHKVKRKALLSYMKNSRDAICPQGSVYLFPNACGDHISVNGVQQFLRRLANKAGLNGMRVSPHVFRHTFGSMYIAKGGSALVLKEIMGHASIQTTQKYVHLQPEQLQYHHSRYSPVGDL